MPTILDENGVVLFSDPIKTYLFKEAERVKVSFRLTDYLVTNISLSQYNFEFMLENWKIGKGVQQLDTLHHGKMSWTYSKCGPRPARVPASMVCINFDGFNFRISVTEMERVMEDYYYQKDNKMHWDA